MLHLRPSKPSTFPSFFSPWRKIGQSVCVVWALCGKSGDWRRMALEAVVFPGDPLGCAWGGGAAWPGDSGELIEEKLMEQEAAKDPSSCCSLAREMKGCWNVNLPAAAEAGGRRKRQRSKGVKNREEVESQRMTHIAVERKRRRQMNEYLAALRSLMPPFYVQRGDQASIVAGAINYVKELEQLLQSLQVQKRLKQQADPTAAFADFFSFPQYSTYSHSSGEGGVNAGDVLENQAPGIANIEVTQVESHANVKVVSRRRPKQLLQLVAGLQSLRLVPLHLNVTSIEHMVMYSFSLKVEDDCQCTSVDEIAAAVHQMLGRIEETAS